MTKGNKKKQQQGAPAERSKRNMTRTGVGKDTGSSPAPTTTGKNEAAPTGRPVCEKCGQVHRACRGHTKHGPNAGKPCGANPRIGQFVCIKHGGNHPAQIKSAKQRLLELVDPALATLYKVLTSDADDSVKVRAALGILDRTGYGPGATLNVQSSKFDEMLAAALGNASAEEVRSTGSVGIDRDLRSNSEADSDDVVDAVWVVERSEDERVRNRLADGPTSDTGNPLGPHHPERAQPGTEFTDDRPTLTREELLMQEHDPDEFRRYMDDKRRRARDQ